MRAAPALFATALFFSHATVAMPAAAQASDAPVFEDSACPFEAAPETLAQVRCGYLIVPQNRDDPDGRQLRLAVAVLKSRSATPRPDPIVYLSGGPGGESVVHTPGRLNNRVWNQLRSERDAVFFDQRGTGYSEPEFCPEVTAEFFRINLLGLTPAEQTERRRHVLGRCAEVMRDEGVDLSQYNSAVSALDLDDLRRALGYEQWNLLGVSYGSRLALEAMRTAPDGIRSAVLDAPAVPNAPAHSDRLENFADVVHRLGAACTTDTACAAMHPDLERVIWSTVRELDADPWLVPTGGRGGMPDTIVFDGSLFAAGLFLGLYQRQFIPIVPVFVQQVRERNSAMALALIEPLGGGIQQMDRGLNLAVNCYEAIPTEARPAARGAERTAYTAGLEHIETVMEPVTAEVCEAWHPFRAGPEHAQPVRSDVPTLVFTGEFDPTTHRSYGALAVAGLSRGQVIEVPGVGHGASPHHPCTITMMHDFFDDPSGGLDQGCVDDIDPVRFVTDVRVAPGVGRVAAAMRPAGGSALLTAAIGLPLIVLFGSALGWPVAAGVRRMRGREHSPPTRFERGARAAAAGFALLVLAFVIGLTWTVIRTSARNPMILAIGLPGWAAPVLVLPWILLAGGMALAVTAALAWRRGAWSRSGRIHFTLFAAAALSFAATLFVMGVAA